MKILTQSGTLSASNVGKFCSTCTKCSAAFVITKRTFAPCFFSSSNKRGTRIDATDPVAPSRTFTPARKNGAALAGIEFMFLQTRDIPALLRDSRGEIAPTTFFSFRPSESTMFHI